MIILQDIFSILLMLVAVNIDTFIVFFSYGSSKIRVPFISALIINLICTVFIVIPMFFSGLIANVIPAETCKIISCALLVIIGLYKILSLLIKEHYKKIQTNYKSFKFMNLHFLLQICYVPEIADVDKSNSISVKEAIAVSIALSIDGISVGIGTGLSNINLILVVIMSVLFNFFSIYSGIFLGKKLTKVIKYNLSWLSGVFLIGLGIFRLF